uniref:Uncharacterized protein n=1 Tax=Chromera velia CCMP2878 TaxID=1169474 RepID=A0A0G4HPC2_9ALVE|eukprot:Cvel_29696.t1-p1 / transcript=Cvel_29696.t1 / gene=Cvel_29696 / organism=Chromera_velia_CCMP2878 / gene_product=hypothetical protein / transcript_product=hypothetical protein / location=Cvel_scaffold4113:4664-5254(+) / protein_length=197 / sequence_SO=supercontig / SO=protein_coding / is_pseudo=false
MSPPEKETFQSFASRGAKLITHFFSSDGLLAKRLPLFYGPNCLFSYLYKLYIASFVGLLLGGRYATLAVGVAGFILNAVGVASTLALHGGLSKLAALPHLAALSPAAWAVSVDLWETAPGSSPVAWLSYVAALSFYVPTLIVDISDLFQFFVRRKYFVLMPDGSVHPLKTWREPDTSVTLDMRVMFATAVPDPERAK